VWVVRGVGPFLPSVKTFFLKEKGGKKLRFRFTCVSSLRAPVRVPFRARGGKNKLTRVGCFSSSFSSSSPSSSSPSSERERGG